MPEKPGFVPPSEGRQPTPAEERKKEEGLPEEVQKGLEYQRKFQRGKPEEKPPENK